MTYSASRFRGSLALRLLQAATVGALAAACSSEEADASGSGASGGAGGDGSGASGAGGPTTQCFNWPQQGAGGAGGAGGARDASGGAGGSIGGAGGAGGAATGGVTGEGGAPACPSKQDASMYILQNCGGTVLSEGTYDAGQCCYQVQTSDCVTGRPLRVDGASLTAPLAEVHESAWTRGARPDIAGLSPLERAALAEAWAGDALTEHASVAAFARLSLELAAFAAPADIVAATHRAALDEVRHAELCFALASTYAGRALGPAQLPLGQSVRLAPDLAALAVATVVEGCIGETLAALVAAAQLEEAQDPAVRAALQVISRDEARHAELAWRTVAWAIRTGGTAVREAVRGAFEDAFARVPCAAVVPSAHDGWLRAHGRLPQLEIRDAMARGLIEVVMPAARRLLGEARASASPAERALA